MKAKITEPQFRLGFILVTTLFFMWGLSYGLVDVLNKHFQEALHITKAQSGLIQAAYFGAYFVIALPAGLFINKKGYKAGIILGLSLYAIGALLFVPAAMQLTFSFFLFALFVLALGLGCLETAANPYSSALGDPATAEQRLNLSQSFNGLGQFFGPLIGGLFFFNASGAEASGNFTAVTYTYVGIALIVIVLIALFAKAKLPDLRENEAKLDAANVQNNSASLWSHSEFKFGVITQFFYVAAQVGVGAFFINLMVETWPQSSSQQGAYFLSIAMLAFLIGRFISTALMSKIAANKLLMIYAIINTVLCAVILSGADYISVIAAIAVFFFMSSMFPTIFAMGVKNLGSKTKIGSSFMIMAIVGGAVMPYCMGKMADHFGTHISYALPLVCFLIVFAYAFSYKNTALDPADIAAN
ncbi:L-fucose:H+ symporter permease [Acinetobacter johnsonii]|uniref:L-fucose:H+ symporter permease n=1 Tax=Acinetobacter johnsonii TaxID=40214 RepID=UPI001EEEC49F|nr:L-fucose:H+ symporter permease [Acinetobacter johnsonii]MCF7642089.1 L-fucose:H+ symporter permease [Acinetobacter johnsonii]